MNATLSQGTFGTIFTVRVESMPVICCAVSKLLVVSRLVSQFLIHWAEVAISVRILDECGVGELPLFIRG